MKHLTLIFTLALAISINSYAQETTSFSLTDAQQHALNHNRSLKNASLEIQKAEASRWKTLASMLPQANVKLDYSNFMGYELKFGGMAIPQ